MRVTNERMGILAGLTAQLSGYTKVKFNDRVFFFNPDADEDNCIIAPNGESYLPCWYYDGGEIYHAAVRVDEDWCCLDFDNLACLDRGDAMYIVWDDEEVL